MNTDYELDILFRGLNVSKNNIIHLLIEPPSDLNIEFNTLSSSNEEIQIFFNISDKYQSKPWKKIEFCITANEVNYSNEIIPKIWNLVHKYYLSEFDLSGNENQYNGHYGENGVYVEFDSLIISAEEADSYGKHTQLLFSMENYNNYNKWKKLDFCITIRDIVVPYHMSGKVLAFVDELVY